jgi:hypothetical protein
VLDRAAAELRTEAKGERIITIKKGIVVVVMAEGRGGASTYKGT